VTINSVSLLKKLPVIVWVSGFYDDNGDGAPDDQPWVDLLEAEGYKVDYTPGNIWIDLDDAKIATLNDADLIIVSRNSNSGDFDDGEEPIQWNAVTTPLILSSTHIIRSSRWKWLDTTSLSNLAPAAGMEILAVDHPVLAGVASPVVAIDAAVGPSTLPNVVEAGNGTVLSKVADADVSWIIEWDTGVEFYDGAGQFAGGPRVFFGAGTQEGTHDVSGAAIGRGEMNLTDAGLAIFLDMVSLLVSGN
ncbi:MAG: hypothetical protein U9Q07_04405, partial [Planctomycetota bacterium]|nr:hypothetical protein [Planctomycetota bacterium]